MTYLLTSQHQAAGPLHSHASTASRASGTSNAISEPRSVLRGTSGVQPWLLRFSDLRIVRPCGEGSFGKARRWGRAAVSEGCFCWPAVLRATSLPRHPLTYLLRR